MEKPFSLMAEVAEGQIERTEKLRSWWSDVAVCSDAVVVTRSVSQIYKLCFLLDYDYRRPVGSNEIEGLRTELKAKLGWLRDGGFVDG